MRGRGPIRALCAASLSAAALLSLAGPAYGVNTAVDVGNLFTFTPAGVTIDQGDTVTWRWVGPDFNHDVFSYPGEAEAYDSHPGINATEGPPGGTFAHTFTNVGTFRYFCSNHSNMQGTVTVHEAQAGSGGPAPAAQKVGRPVSSARRRRAASASASSRSASASRAGSSLASASVTLNGRPVSVRKEDGRLTAQIDLRGFSTGTYDVRIKARTKGGRDADRRAQVPHLRAQADELRPAAPVKP